VFGVELTLKDPQGLAKLPADGQLFVPEAPQERLLLCCPWQWGFRAMTETPGNHYQRTNPPVVSEP